jgi:F-type H+-transporting ATPase subunit a
VKLLLLNATTLAAEAPAGEDEPFDLAHEFELPAWVSLQLGPLDMSINKAVVYLWIASALTILIGIVLMRWRIGVAPDRRQTVGEQIYEVAQSQVAEQGLPSKAIGRWFPYVASLMLFIWTVNMLGFIPLPITGQTFELAGVTLPVWGIYAATSSISVTLALALMTFVFTHVEGVRNNGPVGYFKSWIPEVPKAMLPLLVPLEVLGQFMRLVSLSVRLFANMLAGHMLILTFIGLIFVLESIFLAVIAVPAATAFYLFEVVIVVSIQAFIFAALSAIYIGSAIEPEH